MEVNEGENHYINVQLHKMNNDRANSELETKLNKTLRNNFSGRLTSLY